MGFRRFSSLNTQELIEQFMPLVDGDLHELSVQDVVNVVDVAAVEHAVVDDEVIVISDDEVINVSDDEVINVSDDSNDDPVVDESDDCDISVSDLLVVDEIDNTV